MSLSAMQRVLWTWCLLILGAGTVRAETLERHGVTFTRRPWGIQRPQPRLTEEEAARGWVCFVPHETDGLGPEAFPTRGQIGAPMKVFACPGESEPATFGIYAVRSLSGVTAQAGALVGTRKATISPTAVDIRAVRLWSQRTSGNSREFYIIPELLEKRYNLAVAAGALQQFWVTITVPVETPPGLYEGYVRVSAEGKHEHVPVTLRVLPLSLETPVGKVWGLWSDAARWQGYTDEQVLQEVRDWRAHGISAAVMYPLVQGNYTMRDGELVADLGEFERCVDLYFRAGMKGPVVISLQGLAGLVHGLLGQAPDDYGPEFVRVALDVARSVEKLRTANGWPEFIYGALDDPVEDEALQAEAAATLRILHEAGLRTFTTADVDLANRGLDPFVDVRCYPLAQCAGSAAQAAERQAACRAAGDAYWWYGMGCYDGQEGSIAANRFLAGFLFDKTGAEGAWAWTYQRPYGDPYDDFDGGDSARSKDACITYPGPDGRPPSVPTLQWEGIREGVDDARYLETARRAMEALRQATKPGARGLARRLERRLADLLDGMPWLGGPFSAGMAQTVRWEVASIALEANGLLNDRELLPGPVTRVPAPRADLDLSVSGRSEDWYEPELPVAVLPVLSRPPVIDGQPDAAWDHACKIEDLVAPDGSRNAHRTEAWLARDRAYLYMAFRCHEDNMSGVRAQVTEHDGPVWTDDSVEVFLDPTGKEQSYGHFLLNTLGTRRESWYDLRPPQPALPSARRPAGPEQVAWNIPWTGAVGSCPQGWYAEIAIPLARLRDRGGPMWGINLHRTRWVGGTAEYACWSPTFGGFHVPSRFGKAVMMGGGRGTASLVPVGLELSPATWGDNRAAVNLVAAGNVVAVDVRSQVDKQGWSEWTSYALPRGACRVQVGYTLEALGGTEVSLELVPRLGERPPGEAQSKPRLVGPGQKPPGTPAPAQMLRFVVQRTVPAVMVVPQGEIRLLAGQGGLDLAIPVHLGRALRRNTSAWAAVLIGDGMVTQATIPALTGDALQVSVSTGGLPVGTYALALGLRGPKVPVNQQRLPFRIVPGPW